MARQFGWGTALLLVSGSAVAQIAMPTPPPPQIPPPPVTYTNPAAITKTDNTLFLYSQMILAGAGASSTVARVIREQQHGEVVATKLGVVGFSILLEKAYESHMSKRTKRWVTVVNLAVSVGFGVAATRAGSAAIQQTQQLQGVQPVVH